MVHRAVAVYEGMSVGVQGARRVSVDSSLLIGDLRFTVDCLCIFSLCWCNIAFVLCGQQLSRVEKKRIFCGS